MRNFSSEEKIKSRKDVTTGPDGTETETCANHESDYTLLQRAGFGAKEDSIQFAIQPLLELAEDLPARQVSNSEWFSGANISNTKYQKRISIP
jgi:hypothetical protein